LKVNTYLHFDGNCREAMSFYQQCLGGELQFVPYPDPDGSPATNREAKIMHSHILRDGVPLLMASDTSPVGPVHKGNNFSVSLDCESIEEIERLFKAVSNKGEVRMPLSEMPWATRFGMLVDRFGIQWMFNCALPK